MSAKSTGGLRIGVDIGGTFTDLVLMDEATGSVSVGKLLTTPKESAQAVAQGVLGGTTAKACVIDKGEPLLAREFEVARADRFKKGPGCPSGCPSSR